MKVTKLKAVTRQLFKPAENKPFYVKIIGAIELGKELKGQKPDADGTKRKPAELMAVIDMETGEEGQMIVGSTLKSELEQAYPNNGYVGKTFELIKHALRDGVGGSRYRTWGITEVSIEDGELEEGREQAAEANATDVDPPSKARGNKKAA